MNPVSRLEARVRRQAAQCGSYGSALMETLLTAAADDLAAGGVVADLLLPHADDSAGSAVPLRFAGALHRLVLEGRAPELAPHYPSVGGTAPVPELWPAAERTCRQHLDELRVLVRRPVQTNEVGRAAVLQGVLALVAAAADLPVRLLEIGASAGLNLRCDRFAYEVDDGVVLGDPASPVRLVRPWEGSSPPHVNAQVVSRAGCDPDPLDPTTAEGRLTLTSYVWADQLSRLERLRGALTVAEQLPLVVERSGAADFLRRTLPADDVGVVTVVWHSVVWQYLDRGERAQVDDLLERAGRRRSPQAPLLLAGMEPERTGPEEWAFRVRARLWPGGRELYLADCHGHGPPVHWTGADLAT